MHHLIRVSALIASVIVALVAGQVVQLPCTGDIYISQSHGPCENGSCYTYYATEELHFSQHGPSTEWALLRFVLDSTPVGSVSKATLTIPKANVIDIADVSIYSVKDNAEFTIIKPDENPEGPAQDTFQSSADFNAKPVPDEGIVLDVTPAWRAAASARPPVIFLTLYVSGNGRLKATDSGVSYYVTLETSSTTSAPSSDAPVTSAAPSSQAPSTLPPTTEATTTAPLTQAPTTDAPSTLPPTTTAPETSVAPETTTQAPTSAPSTLPPSTEATTSAPTQSSSAPSTVAPTAAPSSSVAQNTTVAPSAANTTRAATTTRRPISAPVTSTRANTPAARSDASRTSAAILTIVVLLVVVLF